MKIVHVLPFFLPEAVAGTEIYCWSLCKYLQQQGIAAEVLIPNYGKTEDEEYEYDGIRVVKYAEPARLNRLILAGLAPPDGLAAFRKRLATSGADIVHFHGLYGGAGITIRHITAARESGLRVIYTMHLAGHICRTQTLVHNQQEPCDGIIRPLRCAACSLVHHGTSRTAAGVLAAGSAALWRLGIDAAYWNTSIGTALSTVNRIADIKKDLSTLAENCDQIVTLARWFREMMIANGFPTEKLAYLPQALPFSGDPASAPDSNISAPASTFAGPVKLIFIGRIHPLKGLDILLDAMQGLPQGLELSIYGKPEDEAYYQKCRQLSEDNPHIHWRGMAGRNDLLHILQEHDMLCLPSTFSEMSPLVIQEAFGAGIPVLASDAYGNAEQIKHGHNGLLFPFKSCEGLRIQLLRLLNEKELLPALKINIVPPVSFAQVAAEYVDLYDHL